MCIRDSCVVFHSLSKRSNLPGLRSGFVAGDAQLLKPYLLYRTYHGAAMPVQHQWASVAAWQDEHHVIANREQYRQKFHIFYAMVNPYLPLTSHKTVLALSYSYSGYTKLLSPSWVSGDTVAYVLQNPLARDWWLRDLFLSLPSEILTGITWFILVIELLYAPLALIAKLRPWLWNSMLLVQFGFLMLLDFPDLTFGMLVFHLLTFDPVSYTHLTLPTSDLV